MGKFKRKHKQVDTPNVKKTVGKKVVQNGNRSFRLKIEKEPEVKKHQPTPQPKPVITTPQPDKIINVKTNNNIVGLESFLSDIPNTNDLIKYSDKIANLCDNDQDFLDLSRFKLEYFKQYIKGKTIAFVANSSDLLTHNIGPEIDSHNIVVRFNSYKIIPPLTGKKVTIHSNIYLNPYGQNRYAPIKLIISNRLDRWYNAVKEYDHLKYGSILEYNHHQTLIGKSFEPNPLTTGMNTLTLFLLLGGFEYITLYGFNFYDKGSESIMRINPEVNNHISTVHNYGFERYMLEYLSTYSDPIKKVIHGNSTT